MSRYNSGMWLLNLTTLLIVNVKKTVSPGNFLFIPEQNGCMVISIT